jgi:tetratricopeptide (TPR) repeat protein
MHRLRLSLYVSIAFALQAAAQDQGGGRVLEGILGKDDEAFVLALKRSGFDDLAQEVLAALDKAAGKTPDQALRRAILQFQIDDGVIAKEADPLKRVDLLADSIDKREKLVAEHPDTQEALEIADGLPDLYGSIGNLITTAMQDQGLTADVEKLRERGRSMFARAVKKFEERVHALGEQAEKQNPDDEPNEDFEWQCMLASYNLIRTQYLRSLLYDADSFEKKTILDNALDVLTDFQLDFADKLLCYDAFVYEGLCLKEKGDLDGAMSSFDAAIKVRDSYAKGNGGLYDMPAQAAGVVSSAVHQKMLLLTEKSAFAEAAEAARDFFATVPDAIHTPKGRAILSLQAEAYRSLGDQKQMEATARRLIEIDPNGPGGKRGREILGEVGGGSNLGAGQVMGFAEGAAANGEFEEAVARCQQVMILARGTSEATALGGRACLLLGALYAGHGWLHEAVVVWDSAADRYGEAKEAPECLWRAINGYLALQGQEQRPFYKALALERMAKLSKRYPDAPYASMAGLIEGRQLEAELKFAEAAAAYERIPEGSAGGSHEEGIYRAGDAYSQLARKLFQEGKTSEAKTAVGKSEALLLKARPALEAAASQTLDTSIQDKMRNYAFSARMSLAKLYLMEGVDRAAEVLPLLDGAEREFPADATKISTIWSLRSKALQAQGKLDEAMSLLDEQIKQDPDAKWIGASAGALAPILDTRGKELFKADPASEEAEKLWRKAASYYWLAVRAQIEGREAVRVQELEGVATRLLVFAMHFNGVPEGIESFVDWNRPEGRVDELFEQTARVYEAVLPLTPSYRTLINLARTFGFMARWEDAATRYAELFENEPFADLNLKTIRQEALKAKPELIFAFVEWGVCERQAGLEKNDSTRLIRATNIFETLAAGTSKGSKLWWTAKYYQLRTLTDRGEYKVADLGLRDMKRGWNDYDEGKYGFKDKFVELEAELSKKVFK